MLPASDVSLLLAAIYGFASPFTSRLQATALWAGKCLSWPEAAKKMPTGFQDALTDGWPANLSFVVTMLPLVAALVGLLDAWWMAPVGFLVALVLKVVLANRTPAPTTVDRYIVILQKRMQTRAQAYRRAGDTARADAAEDLASGLKRLHSLYVDMGIPAPDMQSAMSAPHGMPTSLFPERVQLPYPDGWIQKDWKSLKLDTSTGA